MRKLYACVMVDAVAHAMKHVGTFKLPTVAEREGLRLGNCAKIMFEPCDPACPVGGERVWYEVIEIDTAHALRYFGMYRCDAPAYLNVPACISFGPRHVIATQEAPE